MTLTTSRIPLIDSRPPFAPNTRLTPVTYTPDDGLNISYGETVAFYPSADLPARFDLDGEYYGVFDSLRLVKTRFATTVQVCVIRQGEYLWLPITRVFKLRDANQRIPRPERSE